MERPPRPSRARTAPYCLRLSTAERAQIEEAALRRGEYISEYLRRCALEEARRDLQSNR